ncbi:Stk1 family PASTA domain-containing Ser/Thr kinase [Cytobacillus purgationiresistens]|uniref:non-specific serine/threonine protein kinase n=1 Tax=Cytobacillus purgationiresistens TaxID=863449 RepID=A0ABU0AGV9_9BACI|nr:Stk1 family PASTA domain-containing Ser/Thr kinase [Cytobacillus purgationiresistens]MDQ0270285.1 serine/threonine-protein kinase [Cytobacillus purgationiresistens]
MIGKRLSGRYKILEMIGGGGMANVYLAHDMILDRDVAVKMLRLDFAEDDEFIRRFHREAQSATSLAHQNIVSIYDVGEEDTLYYIVMEYVEGQTLKQYIQKNSPVPIETALNIMKQLTSAISHAHHNQIIHRDIKPHNILVDPDGNIKITDFGIAMALSATSITQTNSVLGSVHYLSPEQARGGMANRKSDIYSLGIVMFELLTGRLPFSGESAVAIALKHLQSETPSLRRWNPEIPQSVENIVLKATAKDSFHRYNNADEMGEDISSALDSDRQNERKFSIPDDDDATKAIPIITGDEAFPVSDETIVHSNEVKSDSPNQVKTKKEKKKKDKKSTDKKKKKKWSVILVAVFVLLLIIGVLAITVVPDLLSPKDIVVPDVTGEEVEKAVSELVEAGFTVGEIHEINDEEIVEGSVVRTTPKAGKTQKEGATIDIYQSMGKDKYELDDYSGLSFDDVESELRDEGFKSIETEEVYDDEIAEGKIVDQNINPGTYVVPEDEEIVFKVSLGPTPVVLEDLREYNEKGLDVYASSTGLKIDIDKVHDDEITKGLVISQDPEAGAELTKGSTVKVTLSLGKEELPQEVEKSVEIPYEPINEGEPQEIQIYVDDMDSNMSEPFDTFTITENTKYDIKMRIQPGGEAVYLIRRDNTVLDEQTVPYSE